MDVKQLQTVLNRLKLVPTPLVADGIPGKKTMEAVDKMVANSSAKGWQDWTDARRRVAAEQSFYEDVEKIEVGEIDGLIGEQTRYARSVWEARLRNGGKPDPKVELWRDKETNIEVPAGKATPWPRQDQVEKFYGKPGSGFVTVEMPFPFRIAWAPEQTVQKVSVHQLCKPAIERIWRNVLLTYGYEELKKLRLDMFGGCANVRKMRGGSRWSMHAFACAWDVDPDRNQLKFKRESASLDDAPYKKFWEIVESEGALSLGRLKNYDWMHFQFTRDLS